MQFSPHNTNLVSSEFLIPSWSVCVCVCMCVCMCVGCVRACVCAWDSLIRKMANKDDLIMNNLLQKNSVVYR